MQRKRQHIIPNCYLKSWCDPRVRSGQHPFIWRISKDGSRKQPRSPEKSFTQNDRYTVKLPNGQRNLILEETLGGIEDAFVRVLSRVRKRQKLNATDRGHLCIFAAAMMSRTKAFGAHWKNQLTALHQKVAAMERIHNAEPSTSRTTAKMVANAEQWIVVESLKTMAPLLFQMQMTILLTDDELGFITSDNPCVMFNPKLHTFPPVYRHAGLGQKDVEVSLPLTPTHLLLISHRQYSFYVETAQKVVDEANRLTRAHCTEEFVSWKGETRPYWFDMGKKPDDCWEDSEEGKQVLQMKDEFLRTVSHNKTED